MLRFLLLCIIIFLVSCKNNNHQLKFQLSGAIFIDSLNTVEYFIVELSMNNKTNKKIYTTIPKLKVFLSDLTVEESKLYTENTGVHFDKSIAFNFLESNKDLLVSIKNVDSSPIVVNGMSSEIDSLINLNYLRKKNNSDLDSLIIESLRQDFVAFEPFETKKYRYRVVIPFASVSKINSLKIVTNHLVTSKRKSVYNYLVFPDVLNGYSYFKGEILEDSLFISIYH